MRVTVLALTILAAFAGSRADAQGMTACKGRVLVGTVYQLAGAGGRYEYFFTMQNLTNRRMAVEVTFSPPPRFMMLTSPWITVRMEANAMASPDTRFGHGTNSSIGPQTFRIAYDGATSSGPTIRLATCVLL